MSESQGSSIFEAHRQRLASKVDRIFAAVFLFQWLAGIIFAAFIFPRPWSVDESSLGLNLFLAIFVGGFAAGCPIFVTLVKTGNTYNKYVVAVSQMVFSMLFNHLSGGRVETHFHVFGSLAFLAFYRDVRTIVLATLITSLDHFVRGAYWPESVYGVLTATPWRAFEYLAWVLFEDLFLIISIRTGIEELLVISEQQGTLIATAKMSSLGEMAAGIAHEINTPLTIIGLKVEALEEKLKRGKADNNSIFEVLASIQKTTQRIANIVHGLRFFSKRGEKAPTEKTAISVIIDETLVFCKDRYEGHGIRLEVKKNDLYENAYLDCRPFEVSQVLLNLLNNAHDAIEELEEKWVVVEVVEREGLVGLSVTDSGAGIPLEVQEKMMQPFFSTKPVGKGIGLGLSISKGIVEAHHGKFFLDIHEKNTRFLMLFPNPNRKQNLSSAA